MFENVSGTKTNGLRHDFEYSTVEYNIMCNQNIDVIIIYDGIFVRIILAIADNHRIHLYERQRETTVSKN